MWESCLLFVINNAWIDTAYDIHDNNVQIAPNLAYIFRMTSNQQHLMNRMVKYWIIRSRKLFKPQIASVFLRFMSLLDSRFFKVYMTVIVLIPIKFGTCMQLTVFLMFLYEFWFFFKKVLKKWWNFCRDIGLIKWSRMCRPRNRFGHFYTLSAGTAIKRTFEEICKSTQFPLRIS